MNSSLVAASLLITSAALAGTPSNQLTVTASRDNTIFLIGTNIATDRSNGAGVDIFVGRTNGRGSATQRGLVYFDVAAVPANATIVAASVTFFVDRVAPGSGPEPLALHRLSTSWGEGISDSAGGGAPSELGDASWRYRFYPTTLWTTPGGDFVATASASTSVSINDAGSAITLSSAGLAADVNEWVHNPASNFGWLMKGNEAALGTSRAYTSHDAGPSTAPKLTISYIVAPAACNPADICGVGATYNNGAVDIGPDQQLTIEDFLNFLSAFGDATGCPGTAPCNPADICGVGAAYDNGAVDIGPDGELTIEDFLNFLSAFGDATGCP